MQHKLTIIWKRNFPYMCSVDGKKLLFQVKEKKVLTVSESFIRAFKKNKTFQKIKDYGGMDWEIPESFERKNKEEVEHVKPEDIKEYKYFNSSIDEIKLAIKLENDDKLLEKLIDYEVKTKNRKGAIEAFQERIQELENSDLDS